MHATTYGLDVAKRVFQLYRVDGDTGETVNRRFGRDDLIQYLSRRPRRQRPRSPGSGGDGQPVPEPTTPALLPASAASRLVQACRRR